MGKRGVIMKKFVLLLLTLAIGLIGYGIFTIISSQGDASYYSRNRLNLHKNVESFEQRAYDLDGNPVEIEFYDMGYSLDGNVDVEFNKDDTETEISVLDYELDTYRILIFEYDKKGILITEIYENLNYDSVYEYISETDDKGNVELVDGLVKGECEYDDEGYGEFEVEYEYEDGVQVNFVDFDDDGEEDFEIKYSLDGDERIKKARFSSYGDTYMTIKFKYNDKGFIESYEIDEEGYETEYEFEYEYDKKGNWTEMTITIDGDEMYVVEREYDFY